VVKGRASEAVRKLYHTVARAQELAFDQMEAGTPGANVHKAVKEFFDREGYKTASGTAECKVFTDWPWTRFGDSRARVSAQRRLSPPRRPRRDRRNLGFTILTRGVRLETCLHHLQQPAQPDQI